MSEIARSDRQITLFYHSESDTAKDTIAYAHAEGIDVHLIDIAKTPITGTQIAELASSLGIKIRDLVNQEHNSYSSLFESHDLNDLSEEDWIKMIQNNPEIMKQPIALRGDKTLLVKTPSDMEQLSYKGQDIDTL